MRFLAAALIFFGVAASYGQTPEVPHKMQFAGMTLTIRDDARREIQADVDALTRSPKHFAIKAERAKTYFPIIEKIFAEERVPDDFKYLALQESALVSDAVSVSNAVGFWQFKDFTAMEMGMRVDKDIDERMNLISASRGAARYLKQNNYFFNNWVYALQSYQMGAGGVQRSMGDQLNGATHMDITSDTYWYVKKYLAHKIAFEGFVQGEGSVKVIPYEIKSGKTLKEVAVEVSAEEVKLIEYNKWVKNGTIPSDKSYTLLVPVGSLEENFTKLTITPSIAVSKAEPGPAAKESREIVPAVVKDINGIPVIYALTGETITQLAQRGQVDLTDFIKYNETSIDQSVNKGDVFFLAKKKSKADENFYTVKAGDNLWRISQLYGVTIKKLEKYNRISSDEKLAIGTAIWLSETKPKEESLPVVTESVVQLDKETFDWGVKDKIEKAPEAKNEKPAETITLVIDPAPDTIQQKQVAQEVAEVKKTHTVQKGDTYYSIAKLYSLGVVELLTLNQVQIQDPLKVGQVLRLVPQETIQVASEPIASAEKVQHTILHEVKISDTLYSIARQYEVTIKDIMDWNSKNDFALTIGEKLKIIQQ